MTTRLIRFPEEKCEALLRGMLPESEIHDIGEDNVRAILSEPGRTHYANLPSAVLVNGSSDEEKRKRYTMITETALPPFDRVVMINGIDLREFRKRGSMLLFSHGHEESMPLGNLSGLDKNATVRGVDAMVGDANFTAAKVWPFAQLVYEMVDAGVLRGFSIGFDVVDEREPTKAEVAKYKIRSQFGVITTKIKLVEGSVVSLGRDPNAQVMQRVRNSYERRVEALCREGACSQDAADDFLGRVLGTAVCSRSYHMAPREGWAAGVDGEPAPTKTEYADDAPAQTRANTPAVEDAIGRIEARLDSLDQRYDRIEGAGDVADNVAALSGIVAALRHEMRTLRGRQTGNAAEFREAYSQLRGEIQELTGSALPTAVIGDPDPEPAPVRFDDLDPEQQLEMSLAGLADALDDIPETRED